MKLTISESEFVGKSKQVQSNCAAISFYRPVGSNPVNVLGIPVPAGGILEFSQNEDCLDTSLYDVVFGTGAGTNECYVIRIKLTGVGV